MGTNHRRAGTALAAGILTAGLAALAPSSAADAATFVETVTNRADNGSPSSLRGVIGQANTSGGKWTIYLKGGDPYVIERDCQDGDNPDDNHGGDLDIVGLERMTFLTSGNSGPATIEVRCTGERALDVHGMGDLVMWSVRITGGNPAPGAPGDQFGDLDGQDAEPGGAIRSDGDVELNRVTIDNSRTGKGGNGAPPLFAAPGGNGGGGGPGGAVRADQIVATDSWFVGNATGAGGNGGNAVGAGNGAGYGGTGGNGILSAFEIRLTRTVIEGNLVGNGGNGGQGLAGPGGHGGSGGSGGGVYTTDLDARYSSIVHNAAGNGGNGGSSPVAGGLGGPGGRGGGVWAEIGLVATSTVAENAAGSGGAGGPGVPAGVAGTAGEGGGVRSVPGPGVEIRYSTIVGNVGSNGANLAQPAAATVLSSIVGDPQGGTDCLGPITSYGHNVWSDASCTPTEGDLVVAPLPLGPLTDNGGGMPTRMPLPGSVLQGQGLYEGCEDWEIDQRGEVRPSGPCEPGAIEVPVDTASVYVPLSPVRVFDTRQPGPLAGFVGAGETITVPFAGVAGVPADATAVAFNLTTTQSGGAGFVTAFPSGTGLPLASNLNTIRAGQDVPNFAIVPLGDDGAISFYTYAGGHLLADVAGYFVPAQVATSGRIEPMEPTRAFDTRQPGELQGKVPHGQTLTVSLANLLPPEAAAVVLNLTGTQADAAGYITAFPGGSAIPDTSTLNLAGPGHTAANMAIVPLGPDRSISLYSDAGAHLLADITGYVTSETAQLTTAGLTVPLDPVRVFDTRTGPAIPPGGHIDVPTAGTVGIPGNAAAVLLNVTATNATAAGYVTGWPTGEDQPLASMLNVTEIDETRANASIMPVGPDPPGGISYFTDAGTHLLADASGYLVPRIPHLTLA